VPVAASKSLGILIISATFADMTLMRHWSWLPTRLD
jgi:hypothetical protein